MERLPHLRPLQVIPVGSQQRDPHILMEVLVGFELR
jgi:hypothetical protein